MTWLQLQRSNQNEMDEFSDCLGGFCDNPGSAMPVATLAMVQEALQAASLFFDNNVDESQVIKNMEILLIEFHTIH